MCTDGTEGRSAVGENRWILHTLILPAKSLINLTQDQEAASSTIKNKKEMSQNGPGAGTESERGIDLGYGVGFEVALFV